MPLILSKIENQYGEEIIENMYYLGPDGWYNERINCYSSSDLGLGTCRCVSHDPLKVEKVSREAVLSIIKEYPETIKDLTEAEWSDLERYQKDEEYRLECKFMDELNMTPEEFKENILMLKERLGFGEKEIKDMLKKMPDFVREYIEKELNENNKKKGNQLKR